MNSFRRMIPALCWLVACQSQPVQKPVWVNETPLLVLPGKPLQFTSEVQNWQVSLLTFAQPVRLPVRKTASGFMVIPTDISGFLEGPAQLCVELGETRFYYPVTVRNRQQTIATTRDYRSPKTVNPDSSLDQQRIRHAIDMYRNLMPIPGSSSLFTEEELELPSKAGIYRAIRSESLSSYYVQSGSCTSIPIRSRYQPVTNSFLVSAGPLTDKYNNTVADGTLVDFVYRDPTATYHMEGIVLNGQATVLIPADTHTNYWVKAVIHRTTSKTIQLTR